MKAKKLSRIRSADAPTISLDLNEYEAEAIRAVCQSIGGDPVFSPRLVFDRLDEALEAAGIDTVPELAQRNPVNLLNKLTEVNTEKQLVRRLPTQREVANWVDHAKVLPRRVVY